MRGLKTKFVLLSYKFIVVRRDSSSSKSFPCRTTCVEDYVGNISVSVVNNQRVSHDIKSNLARKLFCNLLNKIRFDVRKSLTKSISI